MIRNRLRWIPVAVAPLLIAGGLVATGAARDVELPQRTPQQVLTLLAGHRTPPFSGEVELATQLGLPELPRLGLSDDAGREAATALELLTAPHTLRVFSDGPTRVRVQVMDRLAERDLVRNGSDLWFYDSEERSATHVRAPDGAPPTVPERLTPERLADRVLAALDPSTVVALGQNLTIAGRDAYGLEFRPRTGDSLIESVRIAVDAESGMPLSVTIRAVGQPTPAVSVGFTSLSLQAPGEEVFQFIPPPGTKVTEKSAKAPDHDPNHFRPTILGSGWASIAQLPLGDEVAELFKSPLLRSMTTPVAGGRLLSTSLLSVLITHDGGVFAGSVPPEVLLEAVASR